MIKKTLRTLAFRLSRSDILFWTLPFLMILIIIGTIAQKDLGIYAVQKTYFASIITFIGPVPFPGGALLMSILFVNMLMKFLLFSEWRWIKSGIILTHFGFLLLLAGGFVTAFTSREGYMVIEQGKTSDKIEDYYQRVLSISKDETPIVLIPHQEIKRGMQIADPRLPFTIGIDTYCFNCSIVRRTDSKEGENWQGPARFMHLVTTKQTPKQEENLTGIEFTYHARGISENYATFDKFPKPPTFKIDDHIYKIEIKRAARKLPFSIRLDKFTQSFHPGSEMAKGYRSDVTVKDKGKFWPTAIQMNEPLRYKGFTVYQSSFDLSGQSTFTILNVVENAGRLFPYFASIIMAFGLILHLVIRLRVKRSFI